LLPSIAHTTEASSITVRLSCVYKLKLSIIFSVVLVLELLVHLCLLSSSHTSEVSVLEVQRRSEVCSATDLVALAEWRIWHVQEVLRQVAAVQQMQFEACTHVSC
jgi:hypothetical protein